MTGSIISFLARALTGATARWHGAEPKDCRRVYFANHTSNLDFVLLWSALPAELRRKARPVAAHDYWIANPVRRWLAKRVFRAVLIQRKNVTRENNPLAPMVAALTEGQSLIIFPEGGRCLGDEIGPFKSGIYHLAREMPDLEFLPVYIDNLNRVLPKGEILPVPILCSIHFGSPLQLESGEAKQAFLRRAREAVLTLRGT
jgi:1-acyl-sn-glycerol-3-phosphate acyltransferase